MDIELEIHWRRRKPLEPPAPAQDSHAVCLPMSEIHTASSAETGSRERGNGPSESESDVSNVAAGFDVSRTPSAFQICESKEENARENNLREEPLINLQSDSETVISSSTKSTGSDSLNKSTENNNDYEFQRPKQ